MKIVILAIVALALIPIDSYASTRAHAKELANFLRAARGVITKRKQFIGDPAKIFKSEKFLQVAENAYRMKQKKNFGPNNPYADSLKTAVTNVISNARGGAYKSMWPDGSYANKFLPARFAALVISEFNYINRDEVQLKLTAPNQFLVNESNIASDWESKFIQAFEKMQHDKKWVLKNRNVISFEQSESECRYLLPEMYRRGCMGCHGGEQGKLIHKGNVEGVEWTIGGAITVVFLNKESCE